jgi:hypothetical protein
MKRVYADATAQLARLSRGDFDPVAWQTLCVQAHALSATQASLPDPKDESPPCNFTKLHYNS